MTAPTAGAYELDLRVDIDVRHANSPVMQRVSGDVYQVFVYRFPGRPPIRWRVYRYSWIINAPTVTWFRCRVEIDGAVHFWKGGHLATNAHIVIPWRTFSSPGPAAVTFSEVGGASSSYSCVLKSRCFRTLNLEADVCQSVNIAPLLPTYDTHWHNNRPADLPRRILTFEEAYQETGVCVTINPAHTVINDAAPGFATWSPAELHDAMEVHYSQIGAGWPKWHMWGLLAGTFDSAGVGGIMFDAAAAYGGAGEPPERQGFAVFRNHSWFTNLVPGAPANQNQAWAMRHYLYTWVHEAGHAFNLLHSWNKSRPDSLSWMNYDWKYDQRNGADTFWANFRFRFDDEELNHIRHGDRAAVIMGGDPWASGGHMEASSDADSLQEGDIPVELLLRSKGFYEFLEPVHIELRLRNLLKDIALNLDTRLNPEFGGVIIYIRRPDGRTVEFAPVMCKLGLAEMKNLLPIGQGPAGSDRHSEAVPLSYGSYGFYFDQPGEYLVRAIYQGAGDVLFTSNLHRIRVGTPHTKEEERIAQDYFSYDVGMNLYLNGSHSPFLEKGINRLREIAAKMPGQAVGVQAAQVVANSLRRPFYRLDQYPKQPVMIKAFDADPEQALLLTAPGIEFYEKKGVKEDNLAYHKLVKTRVDLLAQTGKKAAAKKEYNNMLRLLEARGVKQAVLDVIRANLADM
jgi:hypothetical protein